MTTFVDGPAKDQTLMLKGMPKFLRVCLGPGGKWDALDNPKDEPRPEEKLFAYRLKKHVGNCHIHMARGRGGFYPIAEYEVCPEQPSEENMRDTWQWAIWCNTHR